MVVGLLLVDAIPLHPDQLGASHAFWIRRGHLVLEEPAKHPNSSQTAAAVHLDRYLGHRFGGIDIVQDQLGVGWAGHIPYAVPLAILVPALHVQSLCAARAFQDNACDEAGVEQLQDDDWVL